MERNGDFPMVPYEEPAAVAQPQTFAPVWSTPGADKLAGAVADNFDAIFGLVTDLVQSNIRAEQMRGQVRLLETETRARIQALEAQTKVYVEKMRMETDRIVQQAEVIARMTERYSTIPKENRISFDEFFKIIELIVDKIMGGL